MVYGILVAFVVDVVVVGVQQMEVKHLWVKCITIGNSDRATVCSYTPSAVCLSILCMKVSDYVHIFSRRAINRSLSQYTQTHMHAHVSMFMLRNRLQVNKCVCEWVRRSQCVREHSCVVGRCIQQKQQQQHQPAYAVQWKRTNSEEEKIKQQKKTHIAVAQEITTSTKENE